MILYDRGQWVSMVFRTHGSVVKEVMPRVVAVTVVSIVLVLLQETFPVLKRSLTTTPFLLTALPLGIILGFRNSSSYDRFWEARKHWGALVNASRSFTRQIESLIRGGEAAAPLRKQMAYRTIAAVHALRITLRGDKDYGDLRPFLGEDEIATLAGEINPPAAILHRLGRDIGTAFEKGWLDSHHASLLEQTVVQITDVVGACERIKNTPTPISYVLFIHRAVAIYSFLLPFGVLDTVKALTPVVVFFVSYALFSLDAIGDELDDPFRRTPNGLPLTTLARNIEIFVRCRLGESDLPEKIQPVDGVVY
jgi:ion channel-forming bestrophin family protein